MQKKTGYRNLLYPVLQIPFNFVISEYLLIHFLRIYRQLPASGIFSPPEYSANLFCLLFYAFTSDF
ncbi:hypothetical protein EO92_01910 [Methanosarcina sp. 2.H.A.1B.4]|nr:hypothetical protein EO92_01910 [Methanosarcina sp. 2.H.A.1B.4]